MRSVLASMEGELRRYKQMAEGALAQVGDDELTRPGPGGTNSLAVVVWHVGGNLVSRFTDFLTSDGEKPWRHRDTEFEARSLTRAELLEKWEAGFRELGGALTPLSDADLTRTVIIRGQEVTVLDAVHRSLAHVSYHVGQIVFLAHALRSDEWSYLSIPPGRSEDYNRRPTKEKPPPAPSR